MMEITTRAKDLFEFVISAVPSVHRLPTAFEYESPYGKRQIAGTKVFSMIPGETKLNYTIEGIKFNHHFIPLLNL